VVGLAEVRLNISFSLFLPDFAWRAILLTGVALPIVCLLLYRCSRRRVWLWLGSFSGSLLLLGLGIVILYQEFPFQFFALMEHLF